MNKNSFPAQSIDIDRCGFAIFIDPLKYRGARPGILIGSSVQAIVGVHINVMEWVIAGYDLSQIAAVANYSAQRFERPRPVLDGVDHTVPDHLLSEGSAPRLLGELARSGGRDLLKYGNRDLERLADLVPGRLALVALRCCPADLARSLVETDAVAPKAAVRRTIDTLRRLDHWLFESARNHLLMVVDDPKLRTEPEATLSRLGAALGLSDDDRHLAACRATIERLSPAARRIPPFADALEAELCRVRRDLWLFSGEVQAV